MLVKIKNHLSKASLAAFVAVATLAPSVARAVDYSVSGGASDAKPSGANTPTSLFGAGGVFNTISNVLIFLIGAVSVIVIIYGGFVYVTSAGNAKRVESAKQTILYAVIGIVVALLAYAIVDFVAKSFK